jgi:mannose-6-phosphate isomerase-like protein (cupin superfamily)
VLAVIHPDDVEPFADGVIEVRRTFDVETEAAALGQFVARVPPGRAALPSPETGEAVLYVESGRGTLEVGGDRHPLEPDSGVFLRAGEQAVIDNRGPDDVVVVGVLAPNAEGEGGPRTRVIRSAEQDEEEASPERTFRYLVQTDTVTQFLGIVQPSKAPFHSHPYDEVGYIVEGRGVAHIGGRELPLRAGSCFHLAPEEVHCIENVGPGPMRILGVFHPSGSPASRSYQDNNGTGATSKRGEQPTEEENG